MYTNLDIDAVCPQPVIARSHELVFIDLHKPSLDSRGLDSLVLIGHYTRESVHYVGMTQTQTRYGAH